MRDPRYKGINIKKEYWQVLKDQADALAGERGVTISLPDYIMEAAKFYEMNRTKTAEVAK
jgi:hypothetical protein